MSRVFLCCDTNSTMFTSCCETAICDHQQKCPECGEDVHPYFGGMNNDDRAELSRDQHRVRTARWNQAFRPRRTP
jgi:transcription initiation factor IIE alpha subunit